MDHYNVSQDSTSLQSSLADTPSLYSVDPDSLYRKSSVRHKTESSCVGIECKCLPLNDQSSLGEKNGVLPFNTIVSMWSYIEEKIPLSV